MFSVLTLVGGMALTSATVDVARAGNEIEPETVVIDAVDVAGRRLIVGMQGYALSSTVRIEWWSGDRTTLSAIPPGTRADLYPVSAPGEVPVTLGRVVLHVD